MEAVDSVLAHYGKKGMKWGVRKSSTSGPSAVVLKTVPGKRIVAKGGKGQPASDDAKTAAIYRQTAKGSGTAALNNAQLQTAVTRMSLEKQYSSLSAQSSPQSAGKKFVAEILLNVAKQQTTKLVNDAASNQIAAAMDKKKSK